MKYLTLVILIIVFTSCKNSKNNTIDVFYPSGELMISAETSGNRLVGELNYFKKNGDIISTQNWTNGHFDNELAYYDKNLIDFFRNLLILETDSTLFENTNHELEIVNFPEHILSISSNNGTIMYLKNKWIITPENSLKDLKLVIHAGFEGQILEIFSINKKVKTKL